jgi:hypothetical protein
MVVGWLTNCGVQEGKVGEGEKKRVSFGGEGRKNELEEAWREGGRASNGRFGVDRRSQLVFLGVIHKRN